MSRTGPPSTYAGGQLPQGLADDISNLRAFYSKCRSIVCCKCRRPINVTAQGHITSWQRSRSGSVCEHTCSNCSASTCLGCGKKATVGVTCKTASSGEVLDWCCDKGRLFAVWIFMARYDEAHMQIDSAMKAFNASQCRTGFGQPSSGVGYVDYDACYQLGFGETAEDFFSHHGEKAVKAVCYVQADSKTDKMLQKIVCLIGTLLPSAGSQSGFAKNPPLVLRAFFRLGFLTDKLAELLRNDSINDLTARAPLYFSVFEFVQKLVDQPCLRSIVTARRYSKRHSSGLQAIARNSDGRSKISTSGDCSSLESLIEGLVRQSAIILASSQGFVDKSDRTTVKLCQSVSSLHRSILSVSQGNKGSSGTRRTIETPAEKWAAYHKDYAIEQTDEFEHTNYKYMGKAINPRQSPKGRIPRLVKEIAEMATSLPPGIFVKVSTDRPDHMKCLIIGPDGTPYAGGIFEFDILAPECYPNEPPGVYCPTVDGRLDDINPNLKLDGGVCLSLLGTFIGRKEAMWQVQKSTILQVVLSLQSMIFSEEPWRNEINTGTDYSPEGIKRCREYSEKVKRYTIEWAIFPWLQRCPRIWTDIIHTYFRYHGSQILNNVQRWHINNPYMITSSHVHYLRGQLAEKRYI